MSSAEDAKVQSGILKSIDTNLTRDTPFLLFDANSPSTTLTQICSKVARVDVPVFFEPTSVPKAERLFADLYSKPSKLAQHLTMCSPNLDELYVMSKYIESISVDNEGAKLDIGNVSVIDSITRDPSTTTIGQVDIPEFEANVLRHLQIILNVIPTVILKLGSRGVMLAQNLITTDLERDIRENADDLVETAVPLLNDVSLWKWGQISLRHYLPDPHMTREKIVNVTGAGDSLVGVACAGMQMALENDEVRLSSSRQMFQPQIWHHVSSKSKHLLMFNDAHFDGRIAILDKVMLTARQAAELSLQHVEAVNPALSNRHRN